MEKITKSILDDVYHRIDLLVSDVKYKLIDKDTIATRLESIRAMFGKAISNVSKNSNLVEDIRSYNVGTSNYSEHKIQPWDIILEYGLNYWDGDVVKRILRKKSTDSRKLDYEKIIHICKERIRQIDAGYE